MAAGSEDSIVNIGGKGLSLSSSAVYAIANALSKVRIDSSVLEKLSQCKKIQLISSELLGISSSSSKYLTLIESRAALAVLLSKLVLSDAPIRPVLPSLIEETLNSNLRIDRIDFGSVPGFFNSIYSLNNKNIDELGVTVEEGFVVENSLADLIGLCAILDFSCSSLLNLVDVVAALSCETAKADVSAFDLTISGEGFSVKDETDVASDMKVLLFGSKFVGSVDHFSVSDIPVIHGNFRGLVKSVHSRTRVELNSVVRFRKTGCSNNGKGKILVATLLPLITSIRSVGEISLGRAKMSIDSIPVSNERSHVFEIFERHCPNCDILRDKVMSIMGNASLPSDSFGVLHGIYDLLITLRRILAWEAAISLYVLNDVDSDNKIETEFKGLVVDGIAERKNEKKRKKKVLGKGTSIVRQILKERFQDGEDIVNDQVVILVEWAEKLASFFDPVDDSLDSLLKKVKEIVESNEVRRLPKIPKGTRDFGKEQMAIREKAFSTIVGVFKRHGAVALDTPVFELRETLMGKYGEDSKLIYDLADQGGEICSLRYDLTVPFARYLAMNNINSLKRYQIAKVYRRDNPAKGRYREFYQCDFDIAGQYEVMEPDFEVVKVLTELLNELNIGDYEIKLNHRKLLDGMLEICGVPSDKFRTICSSIDKLDKQTFEQIKKEMVEEKGLSNETADKIGSFVSKRGPPLDVLADLKEGSQFLENEGSILALHELEILFKALDKSKCINKIVFDLSLARGLDYYTGVIFEAVFKGTTQVGSIAAGGRYDNLVGMFSGGRQERQVPAVGVSLGIERVFTIMEQLEKDRNQVIRSTETQVLVVILGKDLSLASELVSELWNAKIKAEFSINKRMMKQIERAKQSCIRWMVIVGESEQSGGVAKVKDIEANKEEVVSRERLVEEIQRRLNSDLSTSYVTL